MKPDFMDKTPASIDQSNATRQAKSKPGNYKWIPPEWENMTEAERDAAFFRMCREPDYGEVVMFLKYR